MGLIADIELITSTLTEVLAVLDSMTLSPQLTAAKLKVESALHVLQAIGL